VGIQGIVSRPSVASLIDCHTGTPCCLLTTQLIAVKLKL